jgi:diguanylate cyclase (GGDEF)-like protein/hemerythrin-like metal-binding protein
MLNVALSYALVIVTVSLTLVTLTMAIGRNERHLWIYAVGFAFSSACFLLYIFQTSLVHFIGIVFSNLLLILFHLFMVWGIRSFYSLQPAWPRRFWAYTAVYVAGMAALTYGISVFSWRAALTSAFIVIIVLEFLKTLIRNSYDTLNAIRYPVIACFAFCAAFHVVRCVLLATGLFSGDGLFFNNPLTTLTIAFTIVFSIVWSGGIFLLDNAKLVSDLIKKNMMLENMALKDELTGLFNRHSLDQSIVAEMQRQNRYQEPVSLIMLDLDHFKNVNDRFGHDAGDAVLVEAARRVLKGIRSTDFLFRWGGEEFLILMPNTNREGAGLVAEKLRCVLLAAPIDPVGTVTASFGVAERIPGESREDWFRHVDQAMYRAKRGGRNRVELWKPGNEMPVAAVRVEWQKEWESGNKAIDREHREIIALGNALLETASGKRKGAEIKKSVEEVIVAIQRHFLSEEEILRASGYPDLDHHAQIHRTLYAEAREMQESFNKGKTEAPILFDYIIHKLILDHILTTDILYFPYVRNRQNGRQGRS